MFQFTGKVVNVGQKEQVSEKFAKRQIVLTDGGTYPQQIAFQFTQKNCDLLDGVVAGTDVEITFSLKGREYNGKYFTNLDGFRVKKVTTTKNVVADNSNSDLPF